MALYGRITDVELTSGTSLAHYRLLDKVGEGGMGVVWRAQDTTLGREVAIKILPTIFAQDAERLARFEREARVLASLNHPNIAAVHGMHEAGGQRFLAMELVPGEDFARRLERGALTTDEALRVAMQVAEALEVAHAHGIVHRDLKPANIKGDLEGRMKVLDFGLAKAFEGDLPSGEMSLSPTITMRATQAGVILGTAGYMSPEQARGRAVDRRADIWAFGVILFEMLTGKRLFEGETVSDTLAAVLKTEPDWKALPEATPVPVRRLLRRCLEKDPRRRLRDIGDALLEIEQATTGAAPEDAAAAAALRPGAADESALGTAGRSGGHARLLAGVAVAVILGVLGIFIGRSLRPEAASVPLRKFEIAIDGLDLDAARRPLLSPDGTTLLYYAHGKLWLHSLSDLEPRELTAGERSARAFWSPDSSAIGFFRDSRIWRVPVAGGEASAVCSLPGDAVGGSGGAWRADGSMVFSLGNGPLYEVPPRGGDPRVLLEPNVDLETDFHDPQVLPDGRSLIFATHRKEGMDTIETLVEGERKVVLQKKDHVFSYPSWSNSGHILFVRTGTGAGIWAAPFSAGSEISGDPFLIVPDANLRGVGQDGTLVYQMGRLGVGHLVWVNRAGQVTGIIGQPQGGIASPRISPDGTRILVSAQEEDNRDLWIHDVERGTKTRLTSEQGGDFQPTWADGGRKVIFARTDGRGPSLYMQAADGSTPAEKLTEGANPHVSADGRFLSYSLGGPSESDLMYLQLDGDRKPSARVSTKFSEDQSRISPDGRYLLYRSNQSGQEEIYLRSFPGGEGRWQVSTMGGTSPRWSGNGKEIFFVAGEDLMVVDVKTDPDMKLGTPKKLFSSGAFNAGAYDVAADGQRFVFVQGEKGSEKPHVTVVQNWFEEFATAR